MDSGSQGGAEVDSGTEGVRNEYVSTISANDAEKLETLIDTLETSSLGATLLGEKGSGVHSSCRGE